jgi:diadenosine tetraphosphate (Ap4A) HIT family hydrolase
MFVVTPKQHIETLAQLSDAALLDLWRTTAAVLDAMRVGCNAMILNQGDNRNHAHLHLKIRVPEQQFSRAVASWPQQQQQQLRAIWAFRDSLPAEHRGTREAYLLRLQQAQAARRQHSEDE